MSESTVDPPPPILVGTPQTAPDDTGSVDRDVDDFVQRTPGVIHAVVVSSDGLPITASSRTPRDDVDRFAAVACGLIGLANGAAGRLDGGPVKEVIVEMDRALLFVTSVAEGTLLATMSEAGCDVVRVADEMASLVRHLAETDTPGVPAERHGSSHR